MAARGAAQAASKSHSVSNATTSESLPSGFIVFSSPFCRQHRHACHPRHFFGPGASARLQAMRVPPCYLGTAIFQYNHNFQPRAHGRRIGKKGVRANPLSVPLAGAKAQATQIFSPPEPAAKTQPAGAGFPNLMPRPQRVSQHHPRQHQRGLKQGFPHRETPAARPSCQFACQIKTRSHCQPTETQVKQESQCGQPLRIGVGCPERQASHRAEMVGAPGSHFPPEETIGQGGRKRLHERARRLSHAVR